MRVPPARGIAPIIAAAAILLTADPAIACSTKTKAYVSMMKSDLRNLATAQAQFQGRHRRYSSSQSELTHHNSTMVSPVTIRLTATGYWALVSHERLEGKCSLYVGERPSEALRGQIEGEPMCDDISTRTSLRELTVHKSVATWFWVMIFALTATSALFLSGGTGKWTARVLLVLTVLFPVVVLPACGDIVSVIWLAAFSAPSVALFIYALRRRVAGSEQLAV